MSILNMSLSASFLIFAAVLLRQFFIYRLPKGAFMLLWLIVVFRLLIPISLPSNLSVWNMVDKLIEAPVKTVVAYTLQPFPTSAPTTNAAVKPEIASETPPRPVHHTVDKIADFSAIHSSLLFTAWLSGAVFCALWFVLPHLYALRAYQTAMPAKHAFVEQWIADHPLRRKLSVKQSSRVETPLTYGIWKPVILLPETMDFQDEACLSHVLTHEYVHVRRFDALWKWVLALTLALHWFNPFVWLMYVFANRDIELLCDAAVVRSAEGNAKSLYAMTLLDLASHHGLRMDLCTNFSRNLVEERILAIMKSRRTSCLSIFAALLMIVCTTTLFATDRAAVSKSRTPVGHVERMLFATKDEPVVKVTYDGATWETYRTVMGEENWQWYDEQEYSEYVRQASAQVSALEYHDNKANHDWNQLLDASTHSKASHDWNTLLLNASMHGMESNPAKLAQTLADIQNGIRVSKPKTIHLKNGVGPNSDSIGWVHWCCYSYTFQDRTGNEVNLGLFETRDELFGALRQYYDGEIAAGRLTEAEADHLYGKIAHPVRNIDEVPLSEKLRNNTVYDSIQPLLAKGPSTF